MIAENRAEVIGTKVDAGPEIKTELGAACTAGDLSRLRLLLEAAGVKKGDPPVEYKRVNIFRGPSSFELHGPASTFSLIYRAVTHKHTSVLAYLLDTYPSARVKDESILYTACENPHLPTFKLLYTHDPSIRDTEFEATGVTLLGQACVSGDPTLPNFLLDQGADPRDGGCGIFTDPLECAVRYDQPVWLIEKMFEKGAVFRPKYMAHATEHRRVGVVNIFMDRCYADHVLAGSRALQDDIRQVGDEELTMVLERRIGKASETCHTNLAEKTTRRGWRSWIRGLFWRRKKASVSNEKELSLYSDDSSLA
ncbi:MAG: hypothetical protein Q9160_008392 [Pyrenula sp. 1 TL-2023]